METDAYCSQAHSRVAAGLGVCPARNRGIVFAGAAGNSVHPDRAVHSFQRIRLGAQAAAEIAPALSKTCGYSREGAGARGCVDAARLWARNAALKAVGSGANLGPGAWPNPR